MLDIDEFKKYNDHFGHIHGDDCIKKIADVLYASIRRPADFIGRYGGEEFVILLPGTDLIGANQLGETILNNITSQTIAHAPDAGRDVVTLSIGCYAIMPSIENSPELLLASADKALYVATKNGRGCVYSANLKKLDTNSEAAVVT
jgi:diguanylate cyclase (GGDEF)-like protein